MCRELLTDAHKKNSSVAAQEACFCNRRAVLIKTGAGKSACCIDKTVYSICRTAR